MSSEDGDKEVYSCFVCGKDATLCCTGCEVVPYCSEECQKSDLKPKSSGGGHKQRCITFQDFALRNQEMLVRDFQFISVVGGHTQQFLRDALNKGANAFTREPENSGLWKFECNNFEDARARGVYRVDMDQICKDGNMVPMLRWGFGDAGVPIDLEKLKSNAVTATSWESFYSACSLPMSNPAALLLYSTLTIFWIINMAEKQKRTDTVHIIGAEKEAYHAPIIAPILDALLSRKINIVMVGDAIPSDMNGFKATVGTVGLSVRCQMAKYSHDQNSPGDMLRTPDLAIALKAGLSTNPKWQEAIFGLGAKGVPLFFTEDTVYSAEQGVSNIRRMATEMLPSPQGKPVAMPSCVLNPFRQPMAREQPRRSLKLAECASAFVFGISKYQ